MKIAFFEIKPEERAFFETRLSGEELYFFEETINEALKEEAEYEAVSLFVHSRVTDEILQKLPQLRYLQTRSTGYDHIKCRALYKRGLVVSNVAGYAGPAVGEFAFSLLLNGMRHTHIALQRTKSGDMHYDDLKGIELFGKTLGVLGIGTIGAQMLRIGKGFGMRLLAWSRTKRPVIEETGAAFCDLDRVLGESDVLMIALPLTPQTQRLIDAERAKRFKKDLIIVNTARGEIIDDALYAQLPNLFCLDVIGDATQITRPNILYTPHMAYYTAEALQRIMEISLENMQAFLAGKPLPNCLKIGCERDYTDQKDRR